VSIPGDSGCDSSRGVRTQHSGNGTADAAAAGLRLSHSRNVGDTICNCLLRSEVDLWISPCLTTPPLAAIILYTYVKPILMQVQVRSSSLVPVPNHPMSDTVAAGLALVELSLDITVAGDDVVWLAVTSPAGEARQPITLPWPRAETTTRSAQLGEPAAGGGQLAATAFGSALFASLFTDAARSRYDATRALAARDRQGVRVRLRVHDPALAALPWELLYDPERGEFLALSQSSPVVRGVAQRQPQAPFAVDGPLRILALAASPAALRSLDIAAERARLEQAVALTDGAVELVWVAGATWRDLQDSLLRGPWHIFHFIGHGYFDDIDDDFALVLADAQNQAQLLGSAAVARLVADHPSLRLVVLNACQGAQAGASYVSLAQLLAERGVPAVLAMQYPIGEAAALEFARTFYTALALRRPVDVATSEARKAMSVAASATWEWATPVLFLGGDGQLWAEQKQEAGIVATTPETSNQNKGPSSNSFDFSGVTGGIIFAQVSSAGHVAIGNNVTQINKEGASLSEWDGKQVIEKALDDLKSLLNTLSLAETDKAKALAQLELLHDEFLAPDAAPNAAMAARIVDRLGKTAPALIGNLHAFLALPAVKTALRPL
jgi:hypothetical protein